MYGARELKGSTAFIALQESEREQIMKYGVPADKIDIIPVGRDPSELIDFPAKGTFRRKFQIPEDCPLILFLGRINKKKGADMLVEAFGLLDIPDAWLAIVGSDDGHLAAVMEKVHKVKQANNIIFPGLLSGAEVWSAYQDADIFGLPCRADTFPATIVEACLAGTPMVVTDRCEIAPLIKDRIAEVVPFDPKEFAAAITRLLEDKSKYALYKANCAEMMQETFSLKNSVDKLECCYEKVILQHSHEHTA